VEPSFFDGDARVGRNNVNSIGRDFDAVPRFDNGNVCVAPKQLRKLALMVRVQMLDEDEGHACVSREVLEKIIEGLEAAGRSADSHDGEGFARRGFLGNRFVRFRPTFGPCKQNGPLFGGLFASRHRFAVYFLNGFVKRVSFAVELI
jgi:hypothetical protein